MFYNWLCVNIICIKLPTDRLRQFLHLILNFSILCYFATGSLCAQIPVTVSGMAVGTNTENGISVTVGQLSPMQTFHNGYEVSAGLLQAQVVDSIYTEEGCENVDYDGHGFHFSAPLTLGEHTAEQYLVAGHRYNYDLRKHLILNVNPIYEISKYVTYHGVLPDGVHEGSNDLNLQSVKGCDSLVHLYADLCPYTVSDIDLNPYSTVVVSNLCWTQSNLISTHYSDNSNISNALVYRTFLHPDESANLNTYGRLYTWFSAMHIVEGSNAAPVADEHGFVQGVCPVGWHIPNVMERTALETFPAQELRTAELWVTPNNNTNSTGFTAIPAGKFNSVTNRFEGLGTQTDWWTVVNGMQNADTQNFTSLNIQYYCDTPQLVTANSGDAMSVRCVKNHEQTISD
jgi:uncharacterized protein (TIGR02145 family)